MFHDTSLQLLPKHGSKRKKDIHVDHLFVTKKEANRINGNGELVLQSERTRSQVQNVGDCVQKLYSMIVAAAQIPKEPDAKTLQRIERL